MSYFLSKHRFFLMWEIQEELDNLDQMLGCQKSTLCEYTTDSSRVSAIVVPEDISFKRSGKSTAATFTPVPNSQIQIDNETPWKPAVKYLGYQFDKRLTWFSHVKQTAEKVNISLTLLNPYNPLNLTNKLHLYRTYILPIITYAAPEYNSSHQLPNPRKTPNQSPSQNNLSILVSSKRRHLKTK